MAVLKSFCGVASLRHGTIGVGSFELAGIVTNLFSNEKIQTTGTVRDVVWIMIVLACIVALIVGAFKEKRYYLIPWLIFSVILVALLMFGLVMMCVASTYLTTLIGMHDDEGHPHSPEVDMVGAITGIIIVVVIGLNIFFILVVSSYYVELQNEARPNAVNETNGKIYYSPPTYPA